MKLRIFGIFLILAAATIFGAVSYRNSHRAQQPIVFSSKAMLAELWNSYTTTYVEGQTGRTVDRQRNNVTTSEGQSYTMFRAVQMDDKATFDKSWAWTKANLQREDKLFAWLYGQQPDGTYAVLTDQGGDNSASDADIDIALSLLFASYRWDDPTYEQEAKAIIASIWEEEVIIVQGKPVLAANNLEKRSNGPAIINPSYFAPYAFKIFATVDAGNDWNGLADNSYDLIERVTKDKLDKTASAWIAPDWFTIDMKTGAIAASSAGNLTTNYSYDAMRLPWRLALDYQWFQDERAAKALSNFGFLSKEWQEKQMLHSNYAHDGAVVANEEAPAMYGGSLGFFLYHDKASADSLYENKLKALYAPNTQSWRSTLSYYDDNWAWLGMALYNQELINLSTYN